MEPVYTSGKYSDLPDGMQFQSLALIIAKIIGNQRHAVFHRSCCNKCINPLSGVGALTVRQETRGALCDPRVHRTTSRFPITLSVLSLSPFLAPAHTSITLNAEQAYGLFPSVIKSFTISMVSCLPRRIQMRTSESSRYLSTLATFPPESGDIPLDAILGQQIRMIAVSPGRR